MESQIRSATEEPSTWYHLEYWACFDSDGECIANGIAWRFYDFSAECGDLSSDFVWDGDETVYVCNGAYLDQVGINPGDTFMVVVAVLIMKIDFRSRILTVVYPSRINELDLTSPIVCADLAVRPNNKGQVIATKSHALMLMRSVRTVSRFPLLFQHEPDLTWTFDSRTRASLMRCINIYYHRYPKLIDRTIIH